MDLHRYLVGSQSVVLGNGNEEDIRCWNVPASIRCEEGISCSSLTLSMHLGCKFAFLSLVSLMKFGFDFSSCLDGLDILYGGNVFGHATVKNDFLVLDLDDNYNNNSPSIFVSYFNPNLESIKWHAKPVILAKIG